MGAKDKYKRLATNPKTTVERANEETSIKFANFFDGEDIIEGTILGNDQPYFYTSCCYCGKKWDEKWEEICGNCDKSLEGHSKTINDFYVRIAVSVEDDDKNQAEMRQFRVFRKILGLHTDTMDQEEIKRYLVSLAHQQCRVYFNYPRAEDDPSIMDATYFLIFEKVESPKEPTVKKRKITATVEWLYEEKYRRIIISTCKCLVESSKKLTVKRKITPTVERLYEKKYLRIIISSCKRLEICS